MRGSGRAEDIGRSSAAADAAAIGITVGGVGVAEVVSRGGRGTGAVAIGIAAGFSGVAKVVGAQGRGAGGIPIRITVGRLGVTKIVSRRCCRSPDSAAVSIAMGSRCIAEIVGRRGGSSGGAAIGITVDSSTIAEVIGRGSGGADKNLGESGDRNGYHCSDEGDDLFHDVVFLFC